MPSCAGTVHAARGLWIHDFVIRTTSATSLITLSSKASVFVEFFHAICFQASIEKIVERD